MNTLIIGASRGVGKNLAINFAKTNAKLILIARNELDLKSVQSICKQNGAMSVVYFVCDVSNTKQFIDTLQTITSQYKKKTCIYSAGITSMISDGAFENLYHCDKLLKINLNGAVALTNYILPKMLLNNLGHIVYFSSLGSYYGMAYTPAYCASKAGIRVYAESVRQYCHNTDVNISIITMGFVESDMSKQFIRAKPFLVSNEKAADYIFKGIIKNKAYIRFPYILQLATRIQGILPYKIADWFMIKSGYGRK